MFSFRQNLHHFMSHSQCCVSMQFKMDLFMILIWIKRQYNYDNLSIFKSIITLRAGNYNATLYFLPHWTFIFVLVMMKCQKISWIFFPAFQQYVESLLCIWSLWLPRLILVFSGFLFLFYFLYVVLHEIFVLFNLLLALFGFFWKYLTAWQAIKYINL